MLDIVNTTIPVPGLQKQTILFHLSDMHLIEADERDGNKVIELGESRGLIFEQPDSTSIKEVYLKFLQYADEINADSVVMTGDIIDFPSVANLELLNKTLNNRKYLYTLGNHDWCYPFLPANEDVKHQYAHYFNPFTKGSPFFHAYEINGIRLIAIDNTLNQFSAEQASFLKEQLSFNQPCFVFFHVPVYAPTLVEDVIKVWKYPIMAGNPDSLLDEKIRWMRPTPESQEFIDLLNYNKNIHAVFSGHVHFSHEDYYSDGKLQYVTGAGCWRQGRKITLIPS